MANPIYTIKEKPDYQREIPAITTQTPAHAETVLRPLFESVINNTEYVRQRAEAIAEDMEALTPGDIGADPAGSAAAVQQGLNSHASAANPHSGSVPTTRTVNGKPLSADVTLAAGDVGARPSNWMPTAADVGARPVSWTPTAAEVGAVPTTRTVNGRALSANISLTANDVSALPITGGTLTGQLVAQDSATISKRVRNIQLATTDLTAGSSTLANGVVYMVYET